MIRFQQKFKQFRREVFDITEDITIVYPPAIDYNFMYQRPQQMMKALARAGANVIFINPETFFKQQNSIETPFSDLPNFNVVKKDVEIKSMVKGKLVLWCAVNQGHEIDRLKPDLAIFDSCDLPSDEFSVWKELIPGMEERCQIIFATSQPIYEEHARRGKNVYLLPNGADFDHFKAAASPIGDRPIDLPETNGPPLVGYYGAIFSWLDSEMIHEVANHYPVVLIGSRILTFNHPRITVLDMKFYQALPQYLSWFDVCIIPFKISEMIKATNPVKFYEYISAGKPVVSAPLPELKKYGDVCYFAARSNAVEQIDLAFKSNSVQKIYNRQKIAKQHSWLSRGLEALDRIRKALKN